MRISLLMAELYPFNKLVEEVPCLFRKELSRELEILEDLPSFGELEDNIEVAKI